MTRHDYITALVASDEVEQTQESVCVFFMFLVWYASGLWLCMPGNPSEKDGLQCI